MVIEVLGDEIKAWVNGDLVNHGYGCTATQGKIAVQAEGAEVETVEGLANGAELHPMQAAYRAHLISVMAEDAVRAAG